MSWLYQHQYYWIPRQQTVRHSDGRKVVTTRFGPRDWTRTTTHRDGRKSVARSTRDVPMTKVVGIGMLLVGPAAFLGVFSIPIYVGAALFFMVWLTSHGRSGQSTKAQTARSPAAPSNHLLAKSPASAPLTAAASNPPLNVSTTERNTPLDYEEAYETMAQELKQLLSVVTGPESARSFVEEAVKKLNAAAATTAEFYAGEFYHMFQKAMKDDAKAEIASCERETEEIVSAGKRATIELNARLSVARKVGDQDIEHSIWREGEQTKARNQAAVDALTSRLTAGTWRLRAVDDVGRAFGGRRDPSTERPESVATETDGQPGLTTSSGRTPEPELKSSSSSSNVQGGSKLNAEAFEQAIRARLQEASDEGRSYVVIVSGDVHRSVGGYPSNNHRMPLCCSVMRRLMKPGDAVVDAPPSGQGAKLKIRYHLPR
jgi:hypothetical protein